MPVTPPLLDPCRDDDPREFEFGLCAQLFRWAHEDVRSLLTRLRAAPPDWHAGLDPDLLSAFWQRVQSAEATCQHIAKAYDHVYPQTWRLRQEQQAQQSQHQQFLSGFHSRLTYIGSDEVPQHWSHLGWIEDHPDFPAALSRDSGHVILAAGAQGGGKTVLSTVVGEGSQEAEPPLTSEHVLPTSYAFFHIEEQDRLPQLLDGLKKNPKQKDLDLLMTRLGVGGRRFERLRMVVPQTLLPDLLPRLLPYQDLGLEVMPLKVQLAQLGQPGLEGALGADSDTRCVQRMLEDAQEQGQGLEIGRMRNFIETATDLNSTMKNTAHARLKWLEEIASPPGGPGLFHMFGPHVPTVVYLGGPYVGQKRVLPILVGLLHGLMMPSAEHGAFQRLIVVDEVNLLDRLDQAWRAFTRVGRLVRHRGSTLMLMGQDLLCVPDELFGLAEMVFVFMLRNPRIWEHIRERVGALKGRRWDEVSALQVAEAILGMSRSTVLAYRQGSLKLRVRPPLCEHGGYTRAMV